MIFCLSIIAYAQTPQDRATELKKQAQSSLNQKDYIKARYLFKKAYEAFASRENYPQAIECGVQANALYVRENFYKEGFELCRDMEQLLWTGEQNKKKVFYDLRFLINKERLQMYTALKNPAQAKTQLDKLEEMANLAKNDSLTEVLLYTKANYYYRLRRVRQICLDQMQDTETTAFVELPAPAPDPKKTDTPKESGTCISAGTLPMIRIKNTRGLSAEIFSGTSPEMLCHLIKAFTHAE